MRMVLIIAALLLVAVSAAAMVSDLRRLPVRPRCEGGAQRFQDAGIPAGLIDGTCRRMNASRASIVAASRQKAE